MTYQADVGVEALLDVLPVELDAPGADPEEDDAREQELSERPSDAGDQDLE
jgi:hypothetical protein